MNLIYLVSLTMPSERSRGRSAEFVRAGQADSERHRTFGGPRNPCGYKNHVHAARRHKLRRYQVTDAAVYDAQVADDLLDPRNTTSELWADSVYRSAEIESKLKTMGLKHRVHHKGHRNRPPSARHKRAEKPHLGPVPPDATGAPRCGGAKLMVLRCGVCLELSSRGK